MYAWDPDTLRHLPRKEVLIRKDNITIGKNNVRERQ